MRNKVLLLAILCLGNFTRKRYCFSLQKTKCQYVLGQGEGLEVDDLTVMEHRQEKGVTLPDKKL